MQSSKALAPKEVALSHLSMLKDVMFSEEMHSCPQKLSTPHAPKQLASLSPMRTATFAPVQAIPALTPCKLAESGQKPVQPALELKPTDQPASNDSAKTQAPAAAGVASVPQSQAAKPVTPSATEQRDQGTALQAANNSSTSCTADIIQDSPGLSAVCNLPSLCYHVYLPCQATCLGCKRGWTEKYLCCSFTAAADVPRVLPKKFGADSAWAKFKRLSAGPINGWHSPPFPVNAQISAN